MAEPLLRLERVCKRFDGLLAVDDASFAVEAGRITALIGPNGAGKTTLFSIISGFLRPAKAVSCTAAPRSPACLASSRAARHRAHVPGRAAVRRADRAREHRHWCASVAPRRADALAAAAEVASAVGLGDLLGRPAASLTVAGRKRLELARALAAGPELLLLDEVLAGLNPREVAAMVPVIRALVGRGITILMIEHVMQAVMRLAEQVFVLAQGRIIAEGTPQAVVGDAAVIEAYSAMAQPRVCPAREARMSEALLAVSGLAAGYGASEVLHGIDLEVAAGEIVTVLGSNGAGKSTLNRTISGVLRATRGSIRFAGQPSSARSRRRSSRAGSSTCPRRDASFPI